MGNVYRAGTVYFMSPYEQTGVCLQSDPLRHLSAFIVRLRHDGWSLLAAISCKGSSALIGRNVVVNLPHGINLAAAVPGDGENITQVL